MGPAFLPPSPKGEFLQLLEKSKDFLRIQILTEYLKKVFGNGKHLQLMTLRKLPFRGWGLKNQLFFQHFLYRLAYASIWHLNMQ
jgi:hypothetical protein